MDLRERPSVTTERHPWERARAAFFSRVLSEHAAGAPLRVLDVGAGDGFVAACMLAALPAGSAVECYDENYSDALLSELSAECPGVAFSRVRPQGRFDAILLLDVLEHVRDDEAALRELAADHLSDRGSVLVSVPCHMALFTRHDVQLGHYRRYSPARLQALLEAAGLRAIRGGGLFHGLLIPRGFAKLGELARGVRSAPQPQAVPERAETGLTAWRAGWLVTSLVRAALAADNHLSRWAADAGLALPGLSQWALATRRAVHAG